VLTHVPPPEVDRRPVPHARHHARTPIPILGRILTGRVDSGSVKPNQTSEGRSIAQRRRSSSRAAFRRCWPSAASSACRSTRRKPATSSPIAGLTKATVADTLCAIRAVDAAAAGAADRSADAVDDLPRQRRRRSPAREGNKVTSRVIRDRLLQEAEGNVALRDRRARRCATPSKSRAAANCSSRS